MAYIMSKRESTAINDNLDMNKMGPQPASSLSNARARYIAAWVPFCPTTIYQRYNVGDGAYAPKLEYCLKLIGTGSV